RKKEIAAPGFSKRSNVRCLLILMFLIQVVILSANVNQLDEHWMWNKPIWAVFHYEWRFQAAPKIVNYVVVI
ncbi:MAG: hypothetical protein NTX92_08920, partial [Euryarchaeota archaeon]|nr:hypothetical protein [Euryarchaeota archaeon]